MELLQFLEEPKLARSADVGQMGKPRRKRTRKLAQGVEKRPVHEHAREQAGNSGELEGRGRPERRPPALVRTRGRGVEEDGGPQVEQHGSYENVPGMAIPLATAKDEDVQSLPGEERQQMVHVVKLRIVQGRISRGVCKRRKKMNSACSVFLLHGSHLCLTPCATCSWCSSRDKYYARRPGSTPSRTM